MASLVVATSIYSVLTVLLTSMFVFKSWKLGIRALDYLIVIFGLLALGGLVDLVSLLLNLKVFMLGYNVDYPFSYNLSRNFTLLAIIAIFGFSQDLMYERYRLFETSVIISSFTGYLLEVIHYNVSGNLLLLDEFIPFAQPTRLGEFCFDIIALISLFSVSYAYFKQYKASTLKKYKFNSLSMLIALIFFLGTYLYEFSEHFFTFYPIDVVPAAIPMLVILGYLYLSDPYYVYYSTSDIGFLQITTTTGHLLYAVELKDIIKPRDYLISISLSSFYSVLQEIIDPDGRALKIKSIKSNQGVLVFEQVGDILVILHADRLNKILQRSIHHFIRKFTVKYSHIIQTVPGGIVFDPLDKPDDLLRQCLPMLQSKSMITEASRKPRIPIRS